MTELFNFGPFPILETPRLVLRELIQNDAEAVFAIRSDFEVTRYNTGLAYERLDQARDIIQAIRTGYVDGVELRWGITLKDNPRVIGMCGFNYWVRHDRRASVGYDLARAYWGQGLMTEAVNAMVKFGFEQMNLNRIEADADGRNPASARVLEKAGFKSEGVQYEQFYENGGFYNLHLFALLRRKYLARQSLNANLVELLNNIVHSAELLANDLGDKDSSFSLLARRTRDVLELHELNQTEISDPIHFKKIMPKLHSPISFVHKNSESHLRHDGLSSAHRQLVQSIHDNAQSYLKIIDGLA